MAEAPQILNASPLILPARAEQLSLLYALGSDLRVPEHVFREIEAGNPKEWRSRRAGLCMREEAFLALVEESIGRVVGHAHSSEDSEPACSEFVEHASRHSCAVTRERRPRTDRCRALGKHDEPRSATGPASRSPPRGTPLPTRPIAAGWSST